MIELKGYPEDLVAKLSKVKPALKIRKFQNEYMYDVVALNFSNFFVHILGNATISKPVVLVSIKKILEC